jgi:hypothetical protein
MKSSTTATARIGRLLATSLKVSCLVLFAAAARADDVIALQLTQGYPDGYQFYDYLPASGPEQSVPANPYPILLTDLTDPALFDNTAAFAICYDLNNPTDVQTWYDGTFVYATDAPGDVIYMEASYLANMLDNYGELNLSITVRGEISMAIWQIMWDTSTDSEKLPFYPDPAAQVYIDQAAEAVALGQWTVSDASLYPTFMPDNTNSQRFGIIFFYNPPVNDVPEPDSWPLLGTGLLVLAVLLRRRASPSAV